MVANPGVMIASGTAFPTKVGGAGALTRNGTKYVYSVTLFLSLSMIFGSTSYPILDKIVVS